MDNSTQQGGLQEVGGHESLQEPTIDADLNVNAGITCDTEKGKNRDSESDQATASEDAKLQDGGKH